jgi:DNA-binding MarR family transcriptional regulator
VDDVAERVGGERGDPDGRDITCDVEPRTPSGSMRAEPEAAAATSPTILVRYEYRMIGHPRRKGQVPVTERTTGTHRQLTNAVKEALRDLNMQLALLNRRLGGKVDLKDADWTCLDLVNRQGPLSPKELARRTGLHPATLTGVLDRLERGGWVVRERDPRSADRRAVTVRALRERNQELYRGFAGMNTRMDALCGDYSAAELEVIADFLRRTAAAGHDSTEELGVE